MYLLIDKYDSFTYNLYQCFAKEGIRVLVKRNDKISVKEVIRLCPEKIVISPGPKTPLDAGISNEIIKEFGMNTPILGICLGHQCIAKVFGAQIVRVGKIIHGKASLVYHNNKGILKGVPNPFQAARYHSLKAINIPECLEITAQTKDKTPSQGPSLKCSGRPTLLGKVSGRSLRSVDKIVQGIQHKKWPIFGLQCHPESFLTEYGQKIIQNFIKI